MYESTINDTPIMRRRKDDWVNATQILKCCNFPKAKRTKILEKGVQQGIHEKVQGGYGRFQGTWIPLREAQKLAESYGVTPELAPVLYLDTSDANMSIPKKTRQLNKDGTPVKRKYTKKAKNPEEILLKKSKTDLASLLEDPMNPTGPMGSLYRHSVPIQAAQLLYQMPQSSVHAPLGHDILSIENSIPSLAAQNQAIRTEFQNYQMQMQRFHQRPQSALAGVPYFQSHPGYGPMNTAAGNYIATFSHGKLPLSQSTNETTWSHEDHHKDSDTSISSVDEQSYGPMKSQLFPLEASAPGDESSNNSYAAQLLSYFSEEGAPIPYFIYKPPFDFDINLPIDDEGHTPLHWAASTGNVVMVHLLLSKGANALAVNNYGLNPLSKSISFNNCYELNNFPQVLDELEMCLINTDINGRTPLHYLCQFMKVQSKHESLSYYLEIFLNKLSRMTRSTSDTTINLLKNVLDHQDINGDTCSHLAVRYNCTKIANILLSCGARDDLVNAYNETVRFMMMQNPLPSESPPAQHPKPFDNTIYDNTNPSSDAQPEREDAHDLKEVLATPMQPISRGVTEETPDTQKTTVQDDDNSVESMQTGINKLMPTDQKNGQDESNKENISLDEALKEYSSLSTPVPASRSSQNHKPLAVISEKTTVESTPIKNNEGRRLSIREIHRPRPPHIDENGNVMMAHNNDGPDEYTKKEPLPINDLSAMVGNMLSALSNAHHDVKLNMDKDIVGMQEALSKKKKEMKRGSLHVQELLARSELPITDKVQDASDAVTEEIERRKMEVNSKESKLLQALTDTYSSRVLTYAREEKNQRSPVSDKQDANEDQDKLQYALKLAQLQTQRSGLLRQLSAGIRNYAIENKMCKYRKLISFSCGLRVEDVDGLIDGIEESLAELTN